MYYLLLTQQRWIRAVQNRRFQLFLKAHRLSHEKDKLEITDGLVMYDHAKSA